MSYDPAKALAEARTEVERLQLELGVLWQVLDYAVAHLEENK